MKSYHLLIDKESYLPSLPKYLFSKGVQRQAALRRQQYPTMSNSQHKTSSSRTQHVITKLDKSPESFEKLSNLWHSIFPDWPIATERLQALLCHPQLPGDYYIHENGFCFSFLGEKGTGTIGVLGVLPEFRNNGLGTAFIENVKADLKSKAEEAGETFKSLSIGSNIPRFWPQLPSEIFPEAAKFFENRGT